MQCKNYSKLPYSGGVLEQPPLIMSIMNVSESGYEFGGKKISEYTKDDAITRRDLDILTMINNGKDILRFIERTCGKDAIVNCRLSDESVAQYKLEWIAYEVRTWLRDLN